MYKKILIATDSSEYSEGAVREAINIAKACGSQLYAMLAIEINPEFIALAPLAMEEIEKDSRRYLKGVQERAAKEKVNCEITIREGDSPYKLIIEEAEKKQAALIVMGRRGKTGLMKMIMGSVTASVIGHCSGKVLVVPRASSIQWKNIVIATDGSKNSEAAADEAFSLTKHCGSAGTLHAIAVTRRSATEERIQIADNALKEIKSKAEEEHIKANILLVKGKPHESIHEAIIEYSKEKNADIIVMGCRGRTGLERLLMGSVTERVIGHTDRAVLVVK